MHGEQGRLIDTPEVPRDAFVPHVYTRDEAWRELEGAYPEELEGGGWLVAVDPRCAAEGRAAAARAKVPPGDAARDLAYRELESARAALGVETWPETPADALRLIAHARRAAGGPDTWRQGSLPEVDAGELAGDAGPLRVLGRGVDTVYLAAWCSPRPEVRRILIAARDWAKGGEEVYIQSGVMRWRVLEHGRSPYAVVLEGPACTLSVSHHDSETIPSVYVQVRSAWLHRNGPDDVVTRIDRLLSRWCSGGVALHVSRIDLYADVQGLDLDGLEVPRGAWVGRSRWRSTWWESDDERRAALGEQRQRDEDAGGCTLHYFGTHHTGGMFGRGDIAVRYYDKTREIRTSGKGWLRGIWADAGWDGGQVWRVEVQVRGEALRDMVAASTCRQAVQYTDGRGAAGEGAVTHGHAWPMVRRAFGGIWRYVVGRPDAPAGGWISLRVPSATQKQRTRWPVDPRWRHLQRLEWSLSWAEGTRDVAVVRGRQLLERHTRANARGVAAAVWKHGGNFLAAAQGEVGEVEVAPAEFGPVVDAVASALYRPKTLELWGLGPQSSADASRVLVDCDGHLERAEQLEAQLVGTIASWYAARELADLSTVGPPEVAEQKASQRLRALVGRRGADIATAARGAFYRHALSSVTTYAANTTTLRAAA